VKEEDEEKVSDEEEEEQEEEQYIEIQWWIYPTFLAPAQCTQCTESIEPPNQSINVDLQDFESGLLSRNEQQ
jgi:hypothetical protein